MLIINKKVFWTSSEFKTFTNQMGPLGKQVGGVQLRKKCFYVCLTKNEYPKYLKNSCNRMQQR